LKGLIGRARSASYLPREGALYEQFIADLEKLYQQFCDQDGFVYMAYCTSVHLGDPVE